ncbi:MAG: CmcI family methyltransferase [Melioribacter sp.]|uniref:CmcI family methyltransferase n=1 Tax=Rosettibacter primus TaxID=3111523 RepID=UPI00247DE5B4|nr:CmcI family methyltransferase [Melioribacter sp.]
MNELNHKNKLCLVCCFLPLTTEYKNLWKKINDSLKKKNIDFILITSSENYSDLDFPVIHVPIFLHQFNERFKLEEYTLQDLDEEDYLLIERDMFWSNVDIDSYENHYKGFLKCREFYKQLIMFINPSIVFVWGNYLAQSEIFKKLLDLYGIKNHYLERGYLTGTLMIENLLNEELDNNKLKQENNKDLFSLIKNFYINTNITKYPVSYNNEEEKLLLKIKGKKKIISFFPNPDNPLFPREHKLSKEISNLFTSHIEMAHELAKYVEKSNDLFLIIKTHPIDVKEKYQHIESERIIVSDKIYFRSLFRNSNLLIFTTTTLQYEALFYDKPILLLTNSGLKYSSIPNIIKSKEDLGNVLEKLINGDFNKTNNDEIINFVNKIIENYTYFYIDNIPSVKNTEDFCDFISNNIDINGCSENSITKFLQFQNYIYSNCLKNNNAKNEITNDNSAVSLKFYSVRYKEKIKDYYKPILDYYEEKIKKGDLLNIEMMIKNMNGKLNFLDNTRIISKLYDKRELIKRELKWSPSKSAKFLIQAERMIENNKLDEAAKKLNYILNIEPNHIEALNDLAVIHILKENYLYAKRLLEYILVSEPNNIVAKENYEYLLEKINEGNLEQSIDIGDKSKFNNSENLKSVNYKKDYRSIQFTNKSHYRYWWHNLRGNNYLPPCYSFLDDTEWEIVKLWFDESEKENLIGESPVPFISFLLGLIMGNRIDRIVQLGTYAGYSSLLIGFMLRKMNVKNGFISFDIDSHSTEFAKKYIKLASLDEYVRLELSNSTDINTVKITYNHFGDKPPKLIIVDSSHQKDQTIIELNLWFDHLIKGGLMIFHDSSDFARQWDSTKKGGVKSALDEWHNLNPDVRFINIYNEQDTLNTENSVYQDLNGIAIIQK